MICLSSGIIDFLAGLHYNNIVIFAAYLKKYDTHKNF